jgi:hypothetical protein
MVITHEMLTPSSAIRAGRFIPGGWGAHSAAGPAGSLTSSRACVGTPTGAELRPNGRIVAVSIAVRPDTGGRREAPGLDAWTG